MTVVTAGLWLLVYINLPRSKPVTGKTGTAYCTARSVWLLRERNNNMNPLLIGLALLAPDAVPIEDITAQFVAATQANHVACVPAEANIGTAICYGLDAQLAPRHPRLRGRRHVHAVPRPLWLRLIRRRRSQHPPRSDDVR